jgi:ferric-dicitrate binding protein FerR (iron transport regulator)
VILGQRGQPTPPPSSHSWWLRVVLKIFFALQHCLCTTLGLCLRILRATRKTPDEMPFALALTLELTWLSPAQRYQLQAYGSRNPTVDPLWPANVIDFSSYYPERALRRPSVPTPVPTQPHWHWTTACVVACAFMLVAPLLLGWPGQTSGEYATGTGERRSIPLADGSAVTMNTQSHLRVRFSSRGRDVELLAGEALFAVAHDPNRPFRVHARDTIVEASGTEFSVYLGNSGTRVAVTQGRVKVFASPSHGAIMLNPSSLAWADATLMGLDPPPEIAISAGHEARIARDGNTFPDFEVASRSIPTEELQRHTAWVSGQLAFSGEKLRDVVEEFNRYNWRKLRIGDPDIADMRVGGWFRSTQVDEFVSVLTRLSGIQAVVRVDPDSHEQTLELKRQPTEPR